jgi:hypothetical protein
MSGIFTRAPECCPECVYASMIDIHGQNAAQATALRDFSAEHKVELRGIELAKGLSSGYPAPAPAEARHRTLAPTLQRKPPWIRSR